MCYIVFVEKFFLQQTDLHQKLKTNFLRIKKIENISHLTRLRELYIGKNKLTKIEGLETLRDLRLLSIPVRMVHYFCSVKILRFPYER